MYQRLREGFRMLTPTQQGGTRRSPRCAPGSKDFESEAWRWLFENRKLGVGDLVRQGRWKDALMFLSFVMSSYRSLKRDSTFPMHEYIPKSSVSTPRGKQAIMEAMIAIQLNLYDRLHLEEFINLPIEECVNPLSMAVRIMTAATGKVHSSRERKVMPMSSQDAWNLLQSLLNRINGTRNSIRKIRDWAYRLPSCDKRTLLLCAADFKGRIRRSMVPVIITIFYTAVKGALRQSEEMAWSSLQAILPRMSAALRHQMCAYIHGYRKLGYFHVSNLGPSGCCLNDNYLKVCSDLLNELPHFMWRDLYQSLTEKYKISMERRTHFLSKPMSSHISAPRNVYISDNRESDDFSLSTGNGIAYAR